MGTTRNLWNPLLLLIVAGFLCRVLLLIINVPSHFMKALNSACFIMHVNHLDILLVCIASLPMK